MLPKMKNKKNTMKLFTSFIAIILMMGFTVSCSGSSSLAPQDLDYTEDPVDIPNPDRGVYRANDGMVVPIEGSGENDSMVVSGTTSLGDVEAENRVSHVYFDLRYYSDNAILEEPDPFYDEDYRAPATVEVDGATKTVGIGVRGDKKADFDLFYERNIDYYIDQVAPTLPRGESQEISEDGLNYIRDMFQQVRDADGVLIVRFNYAGEGYSWYEAEHPEDDYVDGPLGDVEPDREWVEKHIEQVKPILAEYEDIIMAVDGGLFGEWGEMHSTTFGTDPEAYVWLMDAWLNTLPESRSLLVHGGAALAWYNAQNDTDHTFADIDKLPDFDDDSWGIAKNRLGFFNDSYSFGTDDDEWPPDDWGSLSEGADWPGNPFGTIEDFDRGKVMTMIGKQNNFYGGEAQGDETVWNSFPFIAWEAAYAETVYLNRDYETEVHDRWAEFIYNEENVMNASTIDPETELDAMYPGIVKIFDPVYDGRNGAEYWRDRLGYRLVLRDANASETVSPDGKLEFEGKIQNVGFGNIVNKKDVWVILRAEGGTAYPALTDLDARDWRPDLDSRASNTDAYRDMKFSVPMKDFGELPAGNYNIYLKINDPKEQSDNKRCIRFANKGDVWDAELGANLIGSVKVE